MKNSLVLFQNHFLMHRRRYPLATQLAIAADLGYDGFELHPSQFKLDSPDWESVGDLARRAGVKVTGIYQAFDCIADGKADRLSSCIEEAQAVIQRLARFDPPGYLLYSMPGDPDLQVVDHPWPDMHVRGSAHAEARHWERGARLVAAIDQCARQHGVPAILYTHCWFLSDTPAACLRLIRDAKATHTKTTLVAFHWHFNQANPDLPELLPHIGLERLGYVGLQQGFQLGSSFRWQNYEDGVVDMAQLLAYVWRFGYEGPIICQGYDIGGDPYITAQKAIHLVRSTRQRFERNPALDPTAQLNRL